MLEAQSLSVDLGGRPALSNISLQLGAAKILAILGPNGAGKSTLLRTLSGELTPSRGEVRLMGKSLRQWSPHELARRRALLPQSESLRFAFRVQEVVAMGRLPWAGTQSALTRQAIETALELADVRTLRDRIYTQLSAGERARVQFARVVAQLWAADPTNESRLLLLDEPTASLDLAHQHQILDAVQRLRDQGLAVVLVVHDLNLAMRYADEVLLLAGGRPIRHGRPLDVLTADTIESIYGIAVDLLRNPKGDSVWIAPRSHQEVVP